VRHMPISAEGSRGGRLRPARESSGSERFRTRCSRRTLRKVASSLLFFGRHGQIGGPIGFVCYLKVNVALKSSAETGRTEIGTDDSHAGSPQKNFVAASL
jgi:hypothetical protein